MGLAIDGDKDVPRKICLSPEERSTGQMNTANLQKALEGMHQDGLLIFEGVVDVDHVEKLNEFMTAETPMVIRQKDPTGGDIKAYNQGVKSNILQGPPIVTPELLYNDVYFNPFVIQLANAYLGTRPVSNYMTGNNALANTKGLRQPVHKDIRFHHPQCPFYFVANIPLCDFNVSNGATEFWLGSHLTTSTSDQIIATADDVIGDQNPGDPHCEIQSDIREQRRAIRAPIQAECQRGDIMIRDLRLWHAGMPNESDEDRIMIAIGYQAPWFPNHRQRHVLPISYCNFFTAANGQPIEMRANFVPDDVAEATRHTEYFDFRPSV